MNSTEILRKAKQIIIEKKHLVTKSAVFDLMARMQNALEMSDDNEFDMEVSNNFTYNGTKEIRINVSGSYFEDRETVFISFSEDYDNVDLCYWCDGTNARLFGTTIYSWAVGLQ